MRITRSIIPNLFTLANLFSGFTAIIHISDGNYDKAAIFIFIAGIFDALDGMMARLTKSTSELGVELDSLCDAVSFGLAPSFMLYKSMMYEWNSTGVLIASLPVLAGVYRLARFNVQLKGFEDKLFFSGMPIPASAVTLVSYIVFFLPLHIIPDHYSIISTTIIIAIVSLAMISTIKYDNLPRPSISLLKSRPIFSLLVFTGFIGSLLSKGALIFPSMLLYLLVGGIRYIHSIVSEKSTDNERDTLEDPDENPFD